jgi:TRAP-type C4-dicarboxylate transport system substrate-binding protein
MNRVINKIGFASFITIFFITALISQTVAAKSEGAPADIPEMKLKVALFLPPVGIFSEHIKWFFDELTKRTEGKVTAELFWQQSLLKDTDISSGVGSGVADVGLIRSATCPQAPLWGTLDLPFNANDNWALIQASYEMAHLHPGIKNEFNKMDLVPTVGYSAGLGLIETIKPGSSLNDMKGMRIRSYGGAFSTLLKEAGMVPVMISLPETYEALSRKVIDGVCSSIQFSWAFKYYKVATYFTIMPRPGSVAASTLVFNKSLWDKMSESLRNIINQLSLDWNGLYAKDLIAADAKLQELLVAKHGVKFLKSPPEEDQAWREAGAKAREHWFNREGMSAARGVWDDFQKRVDHYEQLVQSKGYPWGR